jgi:hypothetical protein
VVALREHGAEGIRQLADAHTLEQGARARVTQKVAN